MKLAGKPRSILTNLAVLLAVLGNSACSSSGDSTGLPEQSETNDLNMFRVASIVVDSDSNGDIDEQFFIFYDNEGLVTRELIDNGMDGVVDSQISYLYEDGRFFGTKVDDEVDGTVDRSDQYTYDSNGVLLVREIRDPADGPVTSRVDYNQDVSGRLIGASNDVDFDGAVDEVAVYTYTSFGKIASIEFDTNVDGITDIMLTFSYGIANEVLTRTRTVFDGSITSIWTYVYEEGVCDPISNIQPPILTCIDG